MGGEGRRWLRLQNNGDGRRSLGHRDRRAKPTGALTSLESHWRPNGDLHGQVPQHTASYSPTMASRKENVSPGQQHQPAWTSFSSPDFSNPCHSPDAVSSPNCKPELRSQRDHSDCAAGGHGQGKCVLGYSHVRTAATTNLSSSVPAPRPFNDASHPETPSGCGRPGIIYVQTSICRLDTTSKRSSRWLRRLHHVRLSRLLPAYTILISHRYCRHASLCMFNRKIPSHSVNV